MYVSQVVREIQGAVVNHILAVTQRSNMIHRQIETPLGDVSHPIREAHIWIVS